MNDDNMDAAREAFEAWWKDQQPSNLDYTSALVGYLARSASPAHTGSAAPVAWLIDWPDEPELGHYFGEEPCLGARNRPLVLASSPAPSPVSADSAAFAVLRRLIALKDHKDEYGKTEHYERWQPVAWEDARAVVTAAPSPVSGADDSAHLADAVERLALKHIAPKAKVLFPDKDYRETEQYRRVLAFATELLSLAPTGQQALSEVARWISVRNQMPEPDSPVLVHNGKWTGVGIWMSDKYLKSVERWQDEYCEFIEVNRPAVTHWMPLPSAPGDDAQSDTVALQAVALTDEQIEAIAKGFWVEFECDAGPAIRFDRIGFAHALLNASKSAHDAATPAPATADAGERPRECSGDPSNCPDNEGCGCWCSDQTRAALSRSDKS